MPGAGRTADARSPSRSGVCAWWSASSVICVSPCPNCRRCREGIRARGLDRDRRPQLRIVAGGGECEMKLPDFHFAELAARPVAAGSRFPATRTIEPVRDAAGMVAGPDCAHAGAAGMLDRDQPRPAAGRPVPNRYSNFEPHAVRERTGGRTRRRACQFAALGAHHSSLCRRRVRLAARTAAAVSGRRGRLPERGRLAGARRRSRTARHAALFAHHSLRLSADGAGESRATCSTAPKSTRSSRCAS